MKFECPSCGAEIVFRSKAIIFIVCSYCKTACVRQDLKLESIGKMAELQDDMSPLQIGTTGQFNKKPFTILGRLRVTYEDGGWNEWFVEFADGSNGWLADAIVIYMFSFESDSKDIPALSDLKPGTNVLVSGTKYHVDDRREVKCLGSEGELPKQAEQGRAGTSVDLSAADNLFATIEYSGAANIFLYIGQYVELQTLGLRNFRVFDGW